LASTTTSMGWIEGSFSHVVGITSETDSSIGSNSLRSNLIAICFRTHTPKGFVRAAQPPPHAKVGSNLSLQTVPILSISLLYIYNIGCSIITRTQRIHVLADGPTISVTATPIVPPTPLRA
jgi:hypothetical protein